MTSDCSGTPRSVVGTTPETKALDQCVNYVSANGQFSGYEILTCSSPGVITSTKYTDSDCSVPDEVNPDEIMVLGSCEQRQGYVLTDWGTSVCQPEEPIGSLLFHCLVGNNSWKMFEMSLVYH